MPLQKLVARQRDVIGTFLRDRQTRVLRIQTAPELLTVVSKLVASFHGDMVLRAVFVAHPGDGDTPAEYFASWAANVVTLIEGSRERWKELPRTAPGLSAIVVPALDAALPLAGCYASWFEAVARLLAPLARGVVLVAFVDDSLEAPTRHALWEFARLIASARVKLVLIDAGTDGAVTPVTSRARHRALSLVAAAHDPRPSFHAFLESDSERVLVVRDGATGLGSLLAREASSASTVRWDVPYRGRARFEQALATEALAELGRAGGANPRALESTSDVERFASSCSAIREARGAARLGHPTRRGSTGAAGGRRPAARRRVRFFGGHPPSADGCRSFLGRSSTTPNGGSTPVRVVTDPPRRGADRFSAGR
jgi:hypothetical protein